MCKVVIQVQNQYWNGTNSAKGTAMTNCLQQHGPECVLSSMHSRALESGSAIRIGRYKLIVGEW